MRRNICNSFLSIAAAIVMTGCETEKEQPGEGTEPQSGMEFAVFLTPYTRASLQEDFSVEWGKGDRMAISDGESWYGFEAVDAGNPAVFKGEAPASDEYIGVYPYVEEPGSAEGAVIVEIPSVQTLSSSAPLPSAALWVGRSRGRIIEMKNTCGSLLLSIVADDVTSVTIEGRRAEMLAGKMTAGIFADSLVLNATGESVRSIELLPAEGGTLRSGTYCFSMAPVCLEDGLFLTFHREGGRSTRKSFMKPLDVTGGSVSDLGVWDLSDPELEGVTTGELTPTCSKVVLEGLMDVVNFNAERMTCGFEYRLASAHEWISVTCPETSEVFSLEVELDSPDPYVYRAWVKLNSSDDAVYGAEVQFSVPTKVLHLVFHGTEGRKLLVNTWGWKTNGNNSSSKRGEEMNNKTYYYTQDGVDYPFTFWAVQSYDDILTGGYTFRHSTNTPNEALCLSNLSQNVMTDGHPAWMQLPGPANLKLVEIDAELKNAFKGHISTAVNEDGTWAGESLAEYDRNSFPITLTGTAAGVRYYFTTEHLNLPRILTLTLTYLYTE